MTIITSRDDIEDVVSRAQDADTPREAQDTVTDALVNMHPRPKGLMAMEPAELVELAGWMHDHYEIGDEEWNHALGLVHTPEDGANSEPASSYVDPAVEVLPQFVGELLYVAAGVQSHTEGLLDRE